MLDKIGGNPKLSTWGEDYARRLGPWASEHIATAPDGVTPVPARLWTSSLQRTILTARHIPQRVVENPAATRYPQQASNAGPALCRTRLPCYRHPLTVVLR